MIAVRVPTVVAGILPLVVAACVFMPWMIVVTSVIPAVSCVACPRIVIVMITIVIMNRVATGSGIGRTAGAGVVRILR